MANYQWDSSALSQVIAIPAAVADAHLKLAGPLQLKVLLWFCANGGRFNADSCAAAVGYAAADCTDAMQYWVSSGILTQTDQAPAPVSAPASKAAPVRRPTVVKPTIDEVVAESEQNSAFVYLLDTLSARLGKPITPHDTETMLYLYRTVGMPVEVLLMVIGYAAEADRFTVRTVEKTALDWADNGIVTIDAAEAHLCYLERCKQALLRVQTACGLSTPLSASTTNMTTAEKWVFAWQLSDDLLRRAADLCRQKTGKFNMAYTNRILENWHEQEITTVTQVDALLGKKAAKIDREPTEYEQLVEGYIPVYRKKKRKEDA